jgi:hypothetical protein
LNATGAKVDRVEKELHARRVPLYRSNVVPIDKLSQLLVTADVHLITLRDPFVGYVLPSKIHACIKSKRRILFIGSETSDVHLLAAADVRAGQYIRVGCGDINGAIRALHAMEHAITAQHNCVPPSGFSTRCEGAPLRAWGRHL